MPSDWLIKYSQHAQGSGQPAEKSAQPCQLAATLTTPYDAKVTTPTVMSMSSSSNNLGQLVKQTANQQQPLRCMPGCKCQPAAGNTVFATQDSCQQGKGCAWQLPACKACMHGLHTCCGTSLGHDLDWHTHLFLRKCQHGSTHTQQQQQRHMLSVKP